MLVLSIISLSCCNDGEPLDTDPLSNPPVSQLIVFRTYMAEIAARRGEQIATRQPEYLEGSRAHLISWAE